MQQDEIQPADEVSDQHVEVPKIQRSFKTVNSLVERIMDKVLSAGALESCCRGAVHVPLLDGPAPLGNDGLQCCTDRRT